MAFNSLLSTELKGTFSGFLVDGSFKKKRFLKIYYFVIFLEDNLGGV